MARLLSTLLVLGLLGGTAAAFAVTEGLKLEKSPILRTRVDKVFSPVCECSTSAASIAFRLRTADRLTLSIERDGEIVRTLVAGRSVRKGGFGASWDGRDDQGRVLPDGVYDPRVHLARAHRTIVLPNPIRIDTSPPGVAVVHWFPKVLTPDGNYLHERLEVRYRVSEPARALLFVGGKRVFLSRFKRTTDVARWFGREGGHGVRARRYRVEVAARDRAGNLSRLVRVGIVSVRYVRLPHRVYRVRAGTRFGTHVRTDSASVRWWLGRRHGVGKRDLVLRAPTRPGRYRLTVGVGDHTARAVVVVEPRQ